MPDFETFLLSLAAIAVIIIAFGFSWVVASGIWLVICQMFGWQFSFAVPTAIWLGLNVIKWVLDR